MKHYAYLVWAYNLVWAGLALYLLYLSFRLRALARKVERMRERLKL